MKKLARLSILISIFIGLPMLADYISEHITMDIIMKCVYLALGLILINFRKVGNK